MDALDADGRSAAPGGVTAISREPVQVLRRFCGRGPTKARSFLNHDYAMCVMEDVLTPAERTLIEAGSRTQVLDSRRALMDAIRDEIAAVLGRHTGQRISRLVMHTDVDLDLTVVLSLFERRREG